ncbi:MAG TPA: fumarate hydratase, partial [bacterium]|nr:fumarate hydratase [bacterium]
MAEFTYFPAYELGADQTAYRLLTRDGVSTASFEGQRIVKVRPEALTELARQALSDVNYFYRTHHLASLRRILDDKEASDNDRYVALTLL